MSNILLKVATEEDMQTVWEMQVKAFSNLLEKYQDYDTSPAAESFEKVMTKYQQPWTTYYFITADSETVGVIRVVGELPRLKKSELRRAFRLCLRSLVLCFRLILQATLILTGVSTSPLLYRVSRPTTLLFLSIFSAPFISAFSTFPSLLL